MDARTGGVRSNDGARTTQEVGRVRVVVWISISERVEVKAGLLHPERTYDRSPHLMVFYDPVPYTDPVVRSASPSSHTADRREHFKFHDNSGHSGRIDRIE